MVVVSTRMQTVPSPRPLRVLPFRRLSFAIGLRPDLALVEVGARELAVLDLQVHTAERPSQRVVHKLFDLGAKLATRQLRFDDVADIPGAAHQAWLAEHEGDTDFGVGSTVMEDGVVVLAVLLD